MTANKTGSKTAAAPGMVRRSYYLPQPVVDDFDQAVQDEFLARRGGIPKHHIVSAFLRIAVAHRDELEAQMATEASDAPQSQGRTFR